MREMWREHVRSDAFREEHCVRNSSEVALSQAVVCVCVHILGSNYKEKKQKCLCKYILNVSGTVLLPLPSATPSRIFAALRSHNFLQQLLGLILASLFSGK